MRVRAIVRFDRAKAKNAMSGNAPSGRALCLSGLLHGIIIAAAFLGTSYFPADAPEAPAAQPIAAERKIIWYPLREMRTITPTERIGTSPVPQGREKRNQAIVRDDPEAKTGKQLVWRPDSAKEIEREIPAPNLIAIEAPREPTKARSIFHLPEPAPKLERPAETRAAPPVPTSALPSKPAPGLPGLLATIPKVTRPFVAPPPLAAHPAKLENTAEPPPVASGELRPVGDPNKGALASVLGNGPAPPRRQFVPPPASKSPGSPGGAVKLPELGEAPLAEGVNAAVLSTAPLDKLLTTVPDGARPVQMSAAPTQGAPSSGPVRPAAGLQIPGLAVVAGGTAPTGGPPVASPKLPPGSVRTVYEETRNAVRRTSLSAPLRPSSRIIPQLIEARFHDRVAYSMIISKPQLPVYAGDWVLWFAEKLPRAGGAAQMRAPQPLRKMEAVDEQPEPGVAGRIQFAAIISKNGQVDSIVVLSGANSDITQAAAIKDLRSWQFAPALSDGQAVDVEVVVEIPFKIDNTTISTGTSRH
jgi:TonB family protein